MESSPSSAPARRRISFGVGASDHRLPSRLLGAEDDSRPHRDRSVNDQVPLLTGGLHTRNANKAPPSVKQLAPRPSNSLTMAHGLQHALATHRLHQIKKTTPAGHRLVEEKFAKIFG